MLMVLASLKFGILSLCNTTGITLHWVTCFDICILYTSTLHFRLHSQKLENLDTNHVDTGMGLERITAILQNKSSNYDTDLFIPIISKLEEVNILVFFCSLGSPLNSCFRCMFLIFCYLLSLCNSVRYLLSAYQRNMWWQLCVDE